ncbi:MAG: hypothetical protein N2712_00295 [Brevinematales bacterium]|nr:hypothetical protein [Brevinematales bacterium]
MKVLLISPSRIVRDAFISELIPRGIEILWCENISEILKKLGDKITSVDVVVVEVISKYDVVSFLDAIKALNVRAAIVLYIDIHSQAEVYEYLKLGVMGFLQKPLKTGIIFNVLSKAYQNFKGAPPERKVVRVQLNEGEGTVDFTLSSGVRVIGSISDLSIGGLAFSYSLKYEDKLVPSDEVFEIRIVLRNEDTYVKGKLKAKIPEKHLAVLVFTELNVDAIHKISKFIFYKTSI